MVPHVVNSSTSFSVEIIHGYSPELRSVRLGLGYGSSSCNVVSSRTLCIGHKERESKRRVCTFVAYVSFLSSQKLQAHMYLSGIAEPVTGRVS